MTTTDQNNNQNRTHYTPMEEGRYRVISLNSGDAGLRIPDEDWKTVIPIALNFSRAEDRDLPNLLEQFPSPHTDLHVGELILSCTGFFHPDNHARIAECVLSAVHTALCNISLPPEELSQESESQSHVSATLEVSLRW